MLTSTELAQLGQWRAAEDDCRWKMGDFLKTKALAKADLRKVADAIQLSLKELQARITIATEVPDDRRDSAHSWSVYKVFVFGLEKPEHRWPLFQSRNEWTVEAAKAAVRRYKEDLGLIKPQGERKSTVRMVNFDDEAFRIKREDSGSYTITIYGVDETWEIEPAERNAKKSVILVTP